jgi:pyruvate-formate lyase
VGERGPAPKATPTFPEITAHSLKDLRILDQREKTSFSVDEKTKEFYRYEVIPFWRGKSIRDRIFDEMAQEWKEAYDAGIFTEFMEQRAPGHTVLDNKIYKKGFLNFKKDIKKSRESLDFLNDPEAYKKREELKRYRDLIVRVAGYSDYSVDLSAELQNEIIQRTEHLFF